MKQFTGKSLIERGFEIHNLQNKTNEIIKGFIKKDFDGDLSDMYGEPYDYIIVTFGDYGGNRIVYVELYREFDSGQCVYYGICETEEEFDDIFNRTIKVHK